MLRIPEEQPLTPRTLIGSIPQIIAARPAEDGVPIRQGGRVVEEHRESDGEAVEREHGPERGQPSDAVRYRK